MSCNTEQSEWFAIQDIEQNQELDFTIDTLGEAKIPNPVDCCAYFVADEDRLSYFSILRDIHSYRQKYGPNLPYLELAGPRRNIYFNPADTVAAVVTCGGICPGLNDVIRSITMTLNMYGVKQVYGIPYGYEGLTMKHNANLKVLNAYSVSTIHNIGGTIIGTSRGPQDPIEMVEFLLQKGIKMLFTIGGDGTQRGAMAIVNEIKRRKLDISVVGIPKTIDNDMRFMEKTFGFETAVEEAKKVVLSAHTEATSAYNGIAIVKLMGRDSGFIAAQAALASMDVNICLVPEVDFDLNGKNGVFELIERRLSYKGHCVIAVAEGAGQKFFHQEERRDKSNNIIHNDIGLFMKQQIAAYFQDHPLRPTIKYIDPSYIIRSQPANADDSIFCLRLGQSAVHAAMSGRTNLVTAYWGRLFTHIPIEYVVSGRRNINPKSLFWQSVLEITRQPRNMSLKTSGI